jgi:hypothetical protein
MVKFGEMFRREFLILGGTMAAIFLSVAGSGFFEVRELHETSVKLVVDTLPGLVDAGLAQERINDNRFILREMLDPHTETERLQMIQTVKTNASKPLWQDYAARIFDEEDRKNYQSMMQVRAEYFQGCEQFQALVRTGNINAASAYFYGELTRRFLAYNTAVEKLFRYNVQQGIARGEIIRANSCYAPWIISVLCVVVFGLGLTMGVRAAWSGGQRQKIAPVHEARRLSRAKTQDLPQRRSD